MAGRVAEPASGSTSSGTAQETSVMCNRVGQAVAGVPTISPQTAAQFSSLSATLQEAAAALRKLVPFQAPGGGSPAPATTTAAATTAAAAAAAAAQVLGSGAGPGQRSAQAAAEASVGSCGASSPEGLSQGGEELTPAMPSSSVLLAAGLSPGQALGEAAGAPDSPGGSGGGAAPTLQQLVSENASLREAFNEANRRLSQLEEEKLRFMDEGVFDLVNSVCGQSGNARPASRTVVRQLLASPDPRPEMSLAMSPVEAITPLPSMSPLLLSPESALASRTRRTEEERRSAELCGENEELRRELARTSEVGEALEEQQQRAEDRMAALEQEQAWLADRLGRLPGGETQLELGALPEVPCEVAARAPEGSAAAEELEARQQLQDRSRALRAELDSAGLPPEPPAEPSPLPEAAAQPEARQSSLERRLRASEARARSLAEENARLQAALCSAASDGLSPAGPSSPGPALEGISTMLEAPFSPARGVYPVVDLPLSPTTGAARAPATPPEAISICTPKGPSPSYLAGSPAALTAEGAPVAAEELAGSRPGPLDLEEAW